MSKLATIRRWGVLVSALLLALQSPLHAELSATQLSAELLTARDEARAPLLAWQTAATATTRDKFEEVKGKIAETWQEGRAKAVETAAANLAASRQRITDQLAGEPERLDRVAKKLKELFDARVKALEEAGKTFDAAASAFPLPTSGDVRQQALDKLTELSNAALAPVSDAEWGKVFEGAATAFAEPTANDRLQEATKSVQSFINAVERDFSRFVHCDYEARTNSLVCDKALAVSGAEISSIDVRGLPTDKTVVVSASAARETAVHSGESAPEWDSVRLTAPHSDQVQVAVYLYRAMLPTYRPELRAYEKLKAEERVPDNGDLSEEELAAMALREYRAEDGVLPPACQEDGKVPRLLCRPSSELALVVSGKAPTVRVTVQVENADGSSSVVSASLELGYARWGVDTGGFYALSWLADEQLKTEPVSGDADKVRITRRGGGSDLSPDTGIFLNLVPKNYPLLGVGVGFSANKDQPNTFYLGGSIRLLSFRNRGVASFSAGATVRSVKRFPGLDEGTVVSKTDPKLQGVSQLKAAPYVVVQLGFSFGRIPGARDGN